MNLLVFQTFCTFNQVSFSVELPFVQASIFILLDLCDFCLNLRVHAKLIFSNFVAVSINYLNCCFI